MNRNSKILAISLMLGLGAVAGCTDDGPDISDNGNPGPLPTDDTAGAEGNTFDHDNSGISAWDLLDRIKAEGPASYTSRVHSCPKMKYLTVGNLLASRGVNMAATGAITAGNLYRTGNNAMAVADFTNRIRENLTISTSAASRQFDVFAAAAPEIIAAMPDLEACKINGVGTPMFNAQNQCTANGITCLTGVPPADDTLALCNLTVARASNIELGKNMAVAVVMAAAHTCE